MLFLYIMEGLTEVYLLLNVSPSENKDYYHYFKLSPSVFWPGAMLTLSTLGKIFSRRHFEIFFLFFSENRIWHFMQIVSLGDNLHEMSNPVFWEK